VASGGGQEGLARFLDICSKLLGIHRTCQATVYARILKRLDIQNPSQRQHLEGETGRWPYNLRGWLIAVFLLRTAQRHCCSMAGASRLLDYAAHKQIRWQEAQDVGDPKKKSCREAHCKR
jgi:hypothetical protein